MPCRAILFMLALLLVPPPATARDWFIEDPPLLSVGVGIAEIFAFPISAPGYSSVPAKTTKSTPPPGC